MCFASVMSDQKEDHNNDQGNNFQLPTKMRALVPKSLPLVLASLTADLLKREYEQSTGVQQGYDLQEHDCLQQLGDANI